MTDKKPKVKSVPRKKESGANEKQRNARLHELVEQLEGGNLKVIEVRPVTAEVVVVNPDLDKDKREAIRLRVEI